MRCDAWTEKALSFVDGLMSEDERRSYAAHLATCEVCRVEVRASRELVNQVRSLGDPVFVPAEAQRFDEAVLARVRHLPAATPESVPAPAVPAATGPLNNGGRRYAGQLAARSISAAARSRLARRRFEPLFAPLPSLVLVALTMVATSIGFALVFGETLARTLTGGFAMAAGSVWSRTGWLLEGAVSRVADILTVLDVAKGVFSHARPWLEATQLFAATHGLEVAIVVGVAGVLITASLWNIRRRRGRARESVRSS